MSDENNYCAHGVLLNGSFPCMICTTEHSEVSEQTEVSEVTEMTSDSEMTLPKDFDFSRTSLSDPFIQKLKLRIARRKIDDLRKMV